MPSYRVFKSTSTFTATTTSVAFSGGSQPELAIEQHQQGSFVGIPTTAHAPESAYISADDQYAGLRLLAEVSTLQVDPFVVLATHQAVTFDDDEDQEQSTSPLSLADEPPQAADDVNPIMVVVEPDETGVSEDPKPPTSQNLVDQNTNSTDKWIMSSGNEIRPFKCGYKGCDKRYTTKQVLQRHFVSHTGGSKLRCYTGDCNGITRYCDEKALARHIYTKHTMRSPYECDNCSKQFARSDILFTHRKNVHSVKDEQNQPQNSDSTDKWIAYSGDETRPFKCDYRGCGKIYASKQNLRKHFVSHIGNSQFRCYTGDCTGAIRFCDSQALARHIRTQHTFVGRSYRCDICTKRFLRRCHLKHHKEEMHSIEKEQTIKKEQKSPPKRKRK